MSRHANIVIRKRKKYGGQVVDQFGRPLGRKPKKPKMTECPIVVYTPPGPLAPKPETAEKTE